MYKKQILGKEAYEIAKIIYYQLDVGQLCHVPKEIAHTVLNHIDEFDIRDNTYIIPSNNQRKRKSKREPSSIGGYVAHKIFKWKITGDIYQIWRFQ